MQDNSEIAARLRRLADLMDAQGANPFRGRAYRLAATQAETSDVSLVELARSGGRAALERLPGIGRSIARQIEQHVRTGQMGLLSRLEGEVCAEARFLALPGVGPKLAQQIHEQLGIESLEELELAAHDGRLIALPGFGERRAQGIRDSLAGILSRSSSRRTRSRLAARTGELGSGPGSDRPQVSTLLDVDSEYRRRTAADDLPRIAPRRFNPLSEDWLPILHVDRDGWSITALFSNTARAHELGRTRDWVVIYYERTGDEGQCTVVTETRGPGMGQRVVRGRELESLEAVADGRRTPTAPKTPKVRSSCGPPAAPPPDA